MTTTSTTDASTETATPTDVLCGLVLDRSASMGGLRGATLEGLNEFLGEQRAIEDGTFLLSILQFADDFQATVVATDVREVADFEVADYVPSGNSTALYDGVASMIDGMEQWVLNHPSWKGKVAIAIWTDGGENSSTRYARFDDGLARLNNRIGQCQARGWDFMFLGTGGSAWTEGANFHTVAPSMMANAVPTAQSTRSSYGAVSDSMTSLRACGASSAVASNYTNRMAANDPGNASAPAWNNDAIAPTTNTRPRSLTSEDAATALAGDSEGE